MFRISLQNHACTQIGTKISMHVSSVLSRGEYSAQYYQAVETSHTVSHYCCLKLGHRAQRWKYKCRWPQATLPTTSLNSTPQSFRPAQEVHGCLILGADSVLWMPSVAQVWLSSCESFPTLLSSGSQRCVPISQNE